MHTWQNSQCEQPEGCTRLQVLQRRPSAIGALRRFAPKIPSLPGMTVTSSTAMAHSAAWGLRIPGFANAHLRKVTVDKVVTQMPPRSCQSPLGAAEQQ
mmetsp:Transcript_124766/g.249153  ORF Transcript_124766/g.249153 Transcript_124766/m.249153 type:complete len:98 (-) Transcript_124766:336-629(-)